MGPRERRLSTREAARLQGLPDWFDFGDQPPSLTYKQLGNGVNVGVVWNILRRHVARDEEVLKRTSPRLVDAVLGAPDSPDEPLAQPHRVIDLRARVVSADASATTPAAR